MPTKIYTFASIAIAFTRGLGTAPQRCGVAISVAFDWGPFSPRCTTSQSCHRFRANEVRLQLECPGLQPGQPLAQTRPAAAGQALVAHESPAAAGENRRPAGEACQVLLAPAGGRASDPAAVRRHVAEDLGAAGAGRLTRSRVQRSLAKKGHKCGAVSEKCPESSGSSQFPVERGPRLTGVGSRITCAEEIWRAERRVGV